MLPRKRHSCWRLHGRCAQGPRLPDVTTWEELRSWSRAEGRLGIGEEVINAGREVWNGYQRAPGTRSTMPTGPRPEAPSRRYRQRSRA